MLDVYRLGAGSDQPGQHRIGWLFALVRRRWHLLAMVSILGAAFAAFIGAQQPPLYTATATVMIEPGARGVLEFQEVSPNLPPDSSTVNNEIAVIKSRTTLRRAIHELNLHSDPLFASSGSRAQQAFLAGLATAC
jgi:uncharacterized protein involved in exopolysaccharide biosynthesis